jgi:mannosyltransferase
VAVALAAATVYALGARLFERHVGLAAGALFAISSYTTGLGRDAGPLALAVLAATVATWLFVVANESGGLTPWCAYAGVAVASVYVHASCALVLLAHGATLVLREHWATRRVLVTSSVIAVLTAPAVVLVLARHRHLIDPLPQPSLADVARAVHDVSGRNVALLALAAGGAAALALGRGIQAETWRLVVLALWACTPLAATLVLSIARPSLDPRYLAVSTPAVALLAAAGLIALSRRELIAVAALATVALTGVRLAQLERSDPENWRAAGSYAEAARGVGERIVVTPARAISAFAYYAGRNKGSLDPGGRVAYVIVRADEETALAAARGAVHVPAYALRGTHSFGSLLQVQEWERTGLPAP